LCFEQYSHEPFIAVARFLVAYAEEKPSAKRLAALHAGGYQALDAMETRLAEHRVLVGDAYSIADIALYAYTHVAEAGGFDLSRYPGIRRWLANVAEQPGHVTLEN
ncbi:MAG: glutathione S-transferase C-terminal domain-containing protein, partial [Solirubrobacteraceae bacterium]|nr:glutathione S-transferase C-terminal domain-containing protein [Solirubrobacteraceae bacterium]